MCGQEREKEMDPQMVMDPYDVVWDTPSRDSSGSMPLGNGDIGLNVWVEENGDLLFYISKTDAWNENGRLLKLGRVRVSFSPNPLAGPGRRFEHRLRLQTGSIDITLGDLAVRVWVDANRPVIRVEAAGPEEFDVRVGLEIWRTRPRILEDRELESAYGLAGGNFTVLEYPDVVLPAENNVLAWYHQNPASVWALTLKHQGLQEWMLHAKDPILHRTFGGAIKGPGLVSEDDTTLRSAAPARTFVVSIHPLTRCRSTVEEWRQQLGVQIAQTEEWDLATTRREHEAWWHAFWERSWIRASGTPEAEAATRGYILQRFINACGGRGKYPIKFNGSIFTVDSREPDRHYDADYRNWGGPYWFQNTRLGYWPMLASGDFDLMMPLFQMYRNALPLAEFRTPLYFNHPGAFFPETMYFWGTYANANYGWDRTDKHVSWVQNGYIHYYWSGALELTVLMLDYYAFTQDDQFLQSTLLPFADAILQFYDKHYGRDSRGKIRFEPAGVLENWHEGVNPLPEIAGLCFVLGKLLELPEDATGTTRQTYWRRLRGQIPDLPTKRVDGQIVLSPAEECIGPVMNCENPELYAIFPYRLFGVGKPGLEIGRRSFERRVNRCNVGWQQEPIQAALLGLGDEAGRMVAERFVTKHPGSRFPAFWGPNYDWIPDQDHGSVAAMALEAMILQCEGDEIRLLPAWPRGWDVDFKLHAPKNTTVEGVFRNGQWQKRMVTPSDRAANIRKMDTVQT